jgi:hypothetical protein
MYPPRDVCPGCHPPAYELHLFFERGEALRMCEENESYILLLPERVEVPREPT